MRVRIILFGDMEGNENYLYYVKTHDTNELIDNNIL